MEQRLIDANKIPFDDNGNTSRFAVGIVPTIDPVYATGTCYCRECEHCLIDLSDRKYHLCMRERMQRRVSLDDFCSRGERGQNVILNKQICANATKG